MQKTPKNPPHSHVPLMTDHCSFPFYSSRFQGYSSELSHLALCVQQMKDACRRGDVWLRFSGVYSTVLVSVAMGIVSSVNTGESNK